MRQKIWEVMTEFIPLISAIHTWMLKNKHSSQSSQIARVA